LLHGAPRATLPLSCNPAGAPNCSNPQTSGWDWDQKLNHPRLVHTSTASLAFCSVRKLKCQCCRNRSFCGHDKFRNYGISIYAAVDAFSRKILCFYLGNSNRRGVYILRQAVTTIRSLRRCPRFWRSDHGNEVLMLADAHFSSYRGYKRSQGLTDEEVDSI
jgi:hypothetical protein